MKKLTTISLVALLGIVFVASAEDEHEHGKGKRHHADEQGGSVGTLPPASTKTGVTYANDIKPILDASCVDCHAGKKAKGHLKLDSLAGVLKGGEEGKIVKPGDGAHSMLVKSVAHATKDREEWMPPLHNKEGIKALLPEEISLIRAWIDQGAK